jgi:hypothetical protein
MKLPRIRTTPGAIAGLLLKPALVAAIVVAAVPSLRHRAVPHVEPALNPVRKQVAADRVARIGRYVEREAHTTGRTPFDRDLPRVLTAVFPGREDVMRDPWGQRFFIRSRGDGFHVGSAGPDRHVGTPDDILSPRLARPKPSS